jgi:hypothetical protein
VDETGQDDRSEYFIVVTVVSESDQDALKESLLRLERQSKVGGKKWHKLRSPEREHFLELVVNAQLAAGEVLFGRYKKPLPFFQPMVETLSKAIRLLAAENYQAVVYVDGIDRKKARELTAALREKGIKTLCSFDYLKPSLEPISAKKGRPSSKLKAFYESPSRESTELCCVTNIRSS